MSIDGPKGHWGIPQQLPLYVNSRTILSTSPKSSATVPLQLHPLLSSVWIWVTSSHTGGSPSYMSAVQCIPARMRLLTLLSCLIGEQNPSKLNSVLSTDRLGANNWKKLRKTSSVIFISFLFIHQGIDCLTQVFNHRSYQNSRKVEIIQ